MIYIVRHFSLSTHSSFFYYELTFHEAKLAASLLVEVSRCGNSSWHGEEVLSPDGSHRHRPAHLRRRHGPSGEERKRQERRGECCYKCINLCNIVKTLKEEEKEDKLDI